MIYEKSKITYLLDWQKGPPPCQNTLPRTKFTPNQKYSDRGVVPSASQGDNLDPCHHYPQAALSYCWSEIKTEAVGDDQVAAGRKYHAEDGQKNRKYYRWIYDGT